jgi:hypothetical protein
MIKKTSSPDERFALTEGARKARVSKDAGPSVASWFETAQERLLTMRVYGLEVLASPHAAIAAINSEISTL